MVNTNFDWSNEQLRVLRRGSREAREVDRNVSPILCQTNLTSISAESSTERHSITVDHDDRNESFDSGVGAASEPSAESVRFRWAIAALSAVPVADLFVALST